MIIAIPPKRPISRFIRTVPSPSSWMMGFPLSWPPLTWPPLTWPPLTWPPFCGRVFPKVAYPMGLGPVTNCSEVSWTTEITKYNTVNTHFGLMRRELRQRDASSYLPNNENLIFNSLFLPNTLNHTKIWRRDSSRESITTTNGKESIFADWKFFEWRPTLCFRKWKYFGMRCWIDFI